MMVWGLDTIVRMNERACVDRLKSIVAGETEKSPIVAVSRWRWGFDRDDKTTDAEPEAYRQVEESCGQEKVTMIARDGVDGPPLSWIVDNVRSSRIESVGLPKAGSVHNWGGKSYLLASVTIEKRLDAPKSSPPSYLVTAEWERVMSYLDRHNASGIKVGDRVRITRAATDREDGWNNVWAASMSNDVGKSFVVGRDGGEIGFRLDGAGRFYFPYFVLEKLTDQPATVSRTGNAITVERDDLVGQLLPQVDQRVTTRRRVEGFRLSNPEMRWTAEADSEKSSEKTPPRAKVGDWVRRISPPIEPGQVVSVESLGLQTGSVSDDDARFVTGFGYAEHGNYEIVRQVVTPWTMKDACEALAKNGFDFETSHSKQTCVAVHDYGLRTKSRHAISFESLARPCQIGEFHWRFPDGTPCGNVSWEVVE